MNRSPEALYREMMAAGDRLLRALKLEEKLARRLNRDPANGTLAEEWVQSEKAVEHAATAYTQSIAQYHELMPAAFARHRHKTPAK